MIPEQKRPKGFFPCVSMAIEFNPYSVYYQTIQEWIDEEGELVAWVSDSERDAAIALDSLWVYTWYPNTPVGSCSLAASSFEALMADVAARQERE